MTGSQTKQEPLTEVVTADRWVHMPRLAMFGVLLAADQWTKRWIVAHFDYGQVEPINGFFNLTRLHNTGAAFSFLADAGGWQKWFFTILGFVVSTIFAVWLWRLPGKDHKLLSAGLVLIISGALGNVIDRLMYGHVIDFLDVFYKTHHWPAFNVADSCIFIGAAFILIDAFVHPGRDLGSTPSKSASEEN